MFALLCENHGFGLNDNASSSNMRFKFKTNLLNEVWIFSVKRNHGKEEETSIIPTSSLRKWLDWPSITTLFQVNSNCASIAYIHIRTHLFRYRAVFDYIVQRHICTFFCIILLMCFVWWDGTLDHPKFLELSYTKPKSIPCWL